MKKLLFLFITLIALTSCSKDEANSSSETSLNPPEWIHGTWKAETELLTSITGFRITGNDVVLVGLVDTSYKGIIKETAEVEEVGVEEVATDQRYELIISFPYGQIISYSFRYMDEDHIIWESSMGDLELTRQ